MTPRRPDENPVPASSAPAPSPGAVPSGRLRAQDPAELLAMARLHLQLVPRDSLVLIGHQRRRTTAVTLRTDLEMVLADGHGRRLEEVFDMLRAEGATGAFALVVLSDGYTMPDPGCSSASEEREELGAFVASRILMTALSMLPQEFDVPEVWVLEAGRARPFLMERAPDGEAGFDLASGPARDLGPISSTLVAADAVLAGGRVPDGPDPARSALRGHRRALRAAEVVRPALPLRIAWGRACAAIDVLGIGTVSDEVQMTACEHLAEFVEAMAEPDSAEALLGLLAGPSTGSIEEILLRVLRSPRCSPGASIRPGGRLFVALESVVEMSAPGPGEAVLGGRGEGWANTASVLSLVEWWNHRYAQGGDLADTVLARDPGHPLARCAAQLTTIPVPPRWRPRRGRGPARGTKGGR